MSLSKIFIPFALVVHLNAGVVYVTPNVLGYEIAQKIIKRMPNAKPYEYNMECIKEAKEAIKMGVNVRLSATRVICYDYILHRNKKPPKQRRATHYIDNYIY